MVRAIALFVSEDSNTDAIRFSYLYEYSLEIETFSLSAHYSDTAAEIERRPVHMPNYKPSSVKPG
jgi:hypothetical protein